MINERRHRFCRGGYNMTTFDSDLNLVASDERLPYEAPELVDCGDVAALTQTGVTNPGADGIYS